MSTYLYRCPNCGDFEETHRMGRAPEFVECVNCHTQSRRVLIMPEVHFKARGFTGAGRRGEGRLDVFRHKDGSTLTDSDKDRVPEHYDE